MRKKQNFNPRTIALKLRRVFGEFRTIYVGERCGTIHTELGCHIDWRWDESRGLIFAPAE
jgi:hypothetical protein